MAAAILLAPQVTACNSKNPDALGAANVDENLAVAESNVTANLEAAEANEPVTAAQPNPPGNVTSNRDTDVDAAVNTLREADADQNEYCEAQREAAGESDCDDD